MDLSLEDENESIQDEEKNWFFQRDREMRKDIIPPTRDGEPRVTTSIQIISFQQHEVLVRT